MSKKRKRRKYDDDDDDDGFGSIILWGFLAAVFFGVFDSDDEEETKPEPEPTVIVEPVETYDEKGYVEPFSQPLSTKSELDALEEEAFAKMEQDGTKAKFHRTQTVFFKLDDSVPLKVKSLYVTDSGKTVYIVTDPRNVEHHHEEDYLTSTQVKF